MFLQTPQKQERQATPKKTPEKKGEVDEYGGSTDVDEPGKCLIKGSITFRTVFISLFYFTFFYTTGTAIHNKPYFLWNN